MVVANEGYLEKLREMYSWYHDVKEQPPGISVTLDLYAHFYQTNQKYFGSKRINLWRVDNEEHCLVKKHETISRIDVDQMTSLLKAAVDRLVNPHPDHMKTVITGVMITKEPLGSEIKPLIEKYGYKKSFKFYLFGWAEVRLIALDLCSKTVICNSAGEEVKKFYEGLFAGENNKKGGK